jgi:hypothetical protein
VDAPAITPSSKPTKKSLPEIEYDDADPTQTQADSAGSSSGEEDSSTEQTQEEDKPKNN